MTTTFGGPDELGPVSDLSTELILDGADAYRRSVVFEQLGAGDGPWFRLPVEGIADAEMGSARPDASFGILEELGGEVDEIGREEVRGVDTRHLRTEVRLGDLLERADPDRRAQLEQQFEGQGVDLGSLGGPTQIDVWIDDDGLLRRMEMAFAITTDGSEATMRQTIEIFGYGEPVEIEVPPADQVSDLDLGVLGGD
jgi:hypothetical protein